MGSLRPFQASRLSFTSALAVMGFCGGLFSTSAWAAYNHSVTWTDMSQVNLEIADPVKRTNPQSLFNPEFPESRIQYVLRDTEKRINKTFRVPQQLSHTVEFWFKVYTQYTTHHLVLFDTRHPEIIYEVLDFRDTAKKAKSRLVYEVIVKNTLARVIKSYHAAFERLAKHRRPKNPSPEEQNILTAISKLRHKHKHDFRDLSKHLRSQTGQRDNVIKGLIAAEQFFPRMEQIFTQMKVPVELTRLSLVESSFSEGAVSRVGAVGVWQFMPDTGRAFLQIDEKASYDERLSPLKSTVGAAKMLKQGFRSFRSWALSVTAYNNGYRSLRRIAGAEDFSKLSHVFDLCKKTRGGLGWASKNYYAEFLAMLYAESYRDLLYGDISRGTLRPVVFRAFGNAQDAIHFALNHGVPLAEFRRLNPDVLQLKRKLPRDFLLAIPADRDDLTSLTGARPVKKITRKLVAFNKVRRR